MKKFLSTLFPFLFRNELSEHQLLRGTPMEERLNTSPAPWIMTVVLVWIASSVLLILTARHAAQAGGMTIGSTALRDFHAIASFEYSDRKENEKLRRELLEKVPIFCRIMPQRTNEIQRDLTDLFSCVETRAAVIKQHRPYDVLKDSLSSRLTASMSTPLLEELASAYLNNRNYENFQRAWQMMLNEGILPAKVRAENKSSMPLRTIDSRGRLGAVRRTGDITDANLAARNLSMILFPQGGVLATEFRQILSSILGDGNLRLDENRRSMAVAEADRSFRPKVRHIRRGEILIKNGEVVTPALMELAAAAEKAIPPELHPVIYYRVALSLILLGVTIFFIFRIYPELVKENRRIMLTGAIVIISMAVNYFAIKVFHSFIAVRLANPVTPVSLQLFVPVALGAILLTVTVGYRVAMCASLLIISTTVLMLAPDRPYELVLRYLVLAALSGLTVRKVTNYRSLFVRGFFATAMIVLVLNCDLIFYSNRSLDELLQITAVAGSNAFITAVLTQVLVFLFELVFNVSTDMSLMVLCDYNHPLLERMKREAPGT
ncbi:MAG: hypothetical protein IKA87_06245, partial [Lentisphaeria bacterium]|nr:hypothetical protein [Lentisphaeria bacterium]